MELLLDDLLRQADGPIDIGVPGPVVLWCDVCAEVDLFLRKLAQ